LKRTTIGVFLAAVVGLAAILAVRAQDSTTPSERVAAARARLGAIEERAAAIGDINAIENLERSYGYYTDKMLWQHVLDLFAADATLEIGTSGVYVGKDSIAKYLYSLSGGKEGPLEGVLYDHMQLQPVVTLGDDGTTAKGRWRALILTGVSGSGSGGNWGEGTYENEYVKEDGVWKIAKLHWYARFIAPYEDGWLNADPADVRAYSEGNGVTPDSPSSVEYEPYPAAFIPPTHFSNPVSGQ
jgi:SnoaL-like domain